MDTKRMISISEIQIASTETGTGLNSVQLDENWIEGDARRFFTGDAYGGRRVLLIGHPGSGKSTLIRKLARDSRNGTETTNQEAEFSVFEVSAAEVRRIGLFRALQNALEVAHGEQLTWQNLQSRIESGKVIPLVDGIEEWVEDETLTPSNPLLSEFLTLVGRHGHFILTCDARLVIHSCFDSSLRLTPLGERFAEPDDTRLMVLGPATVLANDTMDESAFWDFQNAILPDRNNFSELRDRWVHAFQKAGLMIERRALGLLDDIVEKILSSGRPSLTLRDLYELAFDRLDENLRDTRTQDLTVDQVLTQTIDGALFTGDERSGFRFITYAIFEWLLASRMSKAVVERATGERSLRFLLKTGLLSERVCAYFWLESNLDPQHDDIVISLREEMIDFCAEDNEERTFVCNIVRLLVVEARLRGNSQIVNLPAGVDMSETQLAGRDFSGVRMERWRFDNAVLTNARFYNCELVNCSFRGVLAPAIVIEEDKTRTTVSHADTPNFFQGSRMPGSFFGINNLEEWRFTKADLTGSYISTKQGIENADALFRRASIGFLGTSGEITIQRTASTWILLSELGNRLPQGFWFVAGRYEVQRGDPDDEGRASLHIYDHLHDVESDLVLPHEVTDVAGITDSDDATTLVVSGQSAISVLQCTEINSEIDLRTWWGTQHWAYLRKDDGRTLMLVAVPGKGIWDAFNNTCLFPEVLGIDSLFCRVVWGTEDERLLVADGRKLTVLELNKNGKLVEDRDAGRVVLSGEKPTYLAASQSELAVAYEDGSVELLSRRFGWTRRARHLTSFRRIIGLVFAPDQPLLLVLGDWAAEEHTQWEKGDYGLSVFDALSGEHYLYIPELQEKLSQTLIKDAAQQLGEMLQQQGGENREYDLAFKTSTTLEGGQSARMLLGRVEISVATKKMLHKQRQSLVLTLQFEYSTEEPLRRVYTNSSTGQEFPLDMDLVVHCPDGSRIVLEPREFQIEETPDGLLCKTETEFNQLGNHSLEAVLYLGEEMRSLRSDPTAISVRHRNPYTTNPVEGDWSYLFRGNERLVTWVLDNFRNSNLAILAGRRMGKTSLLRRLQKQLSNERDVVAVYLTYEGIAEPYVESGFISRLDQGLRSDERYRGLVPDKPFPNNAGPELAAQYLAELKDRLKQSRGPSAYLVVLADEVDVFISWSQTDSDKVREYFITHAWLRQVAACTPRVRAVEVDPGSSGYTTLLHNRRFMELLEHEEAKALIDEPLAGLIEVDQEAQELLIRYAAGRPFDLQMMLQWVVDRALKEDHRIDASMVNSAFHTTLVPVYQEPQYWRPLQEAAKLADIDKWFDWIDKGLDDIQRYINNIEVGESYTLPLDDAGYIDAKGTQHVLNIPPALLVAWAQTQREQQS